jgi:hypothetical protein
LATLLWTILSLATRGKEDASVPDTEQHITWGANVCSTSLHHTCYHYHLNTRKQLTQLLTHPWIFSSNLFNVFCTQSLDACRRCHTWKHNGLFLRTRLHFVTSLQLLN